MNTAPVKAYNGFSMEELRQQLAVETDVTNLNEIARQLTAHLQRKDLMRKVELSDLEDKIQQQMTKRVVERGDCFSNKDLIDYFKTIDDTITKLDTKETAPLEAPVQINQTLNIGLSREDKQQVLERVRAIVAQAKAQAMTDEIVQGDFEEINEQ